MCILLHFKARFTQLHNSQASTRHRRHVDQLTREGIHLCNGARRTKETSGSFGMWVGNRNLIIPGSH